MWEKIRLQFQSLPGTVKKLGWVSFFADVSSEMLYPITPLFLTTVLGASTMSVGLIEGVAEAIASLLKTSSGFWADRIHRRKPFVVVGYLLAALAKPGIGLSQSWLQVLAARGLDRVGKGLRTAPRDALIVDAVSAENRGAAFGWHRGMDTMGAFVGPLFAAAILQWHWMSLRSIYNWALLPGLAAVAVTLTLKEKPQQPRAGKDKDTTTVASPVQAERTREFRKFLFAWVVFALCNSSDVFLLLRAQKTSGVSPAIVILLYCAYNLIYAVSAPYLGGLSDRWGRKRLLVTGLLVFALVYLGFAFAQSLPQFVVLFLIYGLYMGATDGVGKALVADVAPPNRKATWLGYQATATGLATVVASTAAGYLWDTVGPAAAFEYGAAGALLAAGLLSVGGLRTQMTKEGGSL